MGGICGGRANGRAADRRPLPAHAGLHRRWPDQWRGQRIGITTPTTKTLAYARVFYRLPQAGKAAVTRCRLTTSDPESAGDRKSTRLNSSHVKISYAV